MTIGSENFGNGSAKADDRFGTQMGGYRSNTRRDSGSPLAGDQSTDDFSPRNGSSVDRAAMSMNSGSGALADGSPMDASPIASAISAGKLAETSLTDLGSLSEPMFGRDAWLDAPSGSLADHPLLRGLLLELPPKGTVPQQEWLDRWFEAARAILELIYTPQTRS